MSQKEGFKQIEHTADVGIEAWSTTLEGIFGQVALGMYGIITDISKVVPAEKIEISISGSDIEGLLVDFLNELIFLTDTKELLFSKFKIKIEGNNLKAECMGEKIDPSRHELNEAIKAATYHMLSVKPGRHGFEATVLFDV